MDRSDVERSDDWDVGDSVITRDDITHSLFGLAPGSFLDKRDDIYRLVNLYDRFRVQHEIDELLKNGGGYTYKSEVQLDRFYGQYSGTQQRQKVVFVRTRATENQVRTIGQQFRHIFHASPAGLTLADPSGSIVEVNLAARQLFGV